MIYTFLVPVKLVYVLKTMRLNSEAIFVLKKLYERKFVVKANILLFEFCFIKLFVTFFQIKCKLNVC